MKKCDYYLLKVIEIVIFLHLFKKKSKQSFALLLKIKHPKKHVEK